MGTHVEPEQVAVVVPAGHAAHAPLHSWYPLLHDVPHEVPLQVGAPFASVGQIEHEVVPQLLMLLLLTQAPEQGW